MRKNRSRRHAGGFLVLCFMLVSVFSLLGTGFSFWVFSFAVESGEARIGVEITPLETAGTWVRIEFPSCVVLDEGMGSGINTVKGFSFYKTVTVGEKEEISLDPEIILTFRLKEDFPLSDYTDEQKQPTEDNGYSMFGLQFGFRILVYGPLNGCVHRTEVYSDMIKIPDTGNGLSINDYVNLLAVNNWEWEESERTFTFRLTTALFNRFFDYNVDYRPTTSEHYAALRRQVLDASIQSLIRIELWQGDAA